jgi:hypothetical protein
VLAVEAKQYARPSLRNFYAALVDYAGAHVSANVVLANYGAMSPGLLASPPERSSAFGYVRPDRPAERSAFVERIRTVIPVPSLMPSRVQPAALAEMATGSPVQAVVVLQWSTGLDLDLHLLAIDTGVATNFHSLAGAGSTDPVLLWNDDRSAPGAEVAQVLSGAGPVSVWVHRFSGTDSLSAMRAVVHVHLPDASANFVVRASEHLFNSDWWHVGVITADGTWQTMDQASTSGP